MARTRLRVTNSFVVRGCRLATAILTPSIGATTLVRVTVGSWSIPLTPKQARRFAADILATADRAEDEDFYRNDTCNCGDCRWCIPSAYVQSGIAPRISSYAHDPSTDASYRG